MKIWTVDEIKENLQKSQAWLERAVLAIYDKQTAIEKSVKDTRENNGVGFNGVDAKYLSWVADYLKSGRHLSGKHIDKVLKKMLKYSNQLTKIANGEI